jgi:hypothetical protein
VFLDTYNHNQQDRGRPSCVARLQPTRPVVVSRVRYETISRHDAKLAQTNSTSALANTAHITRLVLEAVPYQTFVLALHFEKQTRESNNMVQSLSAIIRFACNMFFRGRQRKLVLHISWKLILLASFICRTASIPAATIEISMFMVRRLFHRQLIKAHPKLNHLILSMTEKKWYRSQ